MHPEADAQVRDFILASPAGSLDHALSAASAEPAGDENALRGAEFMPGFMEFRRGFGLCRVFQMGGIDPDEIELPRTCHGGVFERLDNGKIGVVKISVFTNQHNRNRLIEMLL